MQNEQAFNGKWDRFGTLLLESIIIIIIRQPLRDSGLPPDCLHSVSFFLNVQRNVKDFLLN